MRWAPLLAVSFAAAGASCQLVYGLGDFHPAGTGGSAAAGGSAGSAGGGAGGGSTLDGGPVGGAPACGSANGVACLTPPEDFGAKYFHLVETTPATAPSNCASGAAPQHYFQEPSAACVACGCGGPPSPPCTSPDIDGFVMSNCPAGQGTTLDQASGDCTGTFGAHVSAAAPKPRACATQGGGRAKDDWKTELTLCEVATSTDGCEGGEVCVPSGEPICMFQSGALADCPAGWGTAQVAYGGADDGLTCGDCSCAPSFTCNGRYLAYQTGANVCLTNGAAIPPDTCTAASYVAYEDRPPSGDMGCSASGGQPSGTFAPNAPVTICCKTP